MIWGNRKKSEDKLNLQINMEDKIPYKSDERIIIKENPINSNKEEIKKMENVHMIEDKKDITKSNVDTKEVATKINAEIIKPMFDTKEIQTKELEENKVLIKKNLKRKKLIINRN